MEYERPMQLFRPMNHASVFFVRFILVQRYIKKEEIYSNERGNEKSIVYFSG